MVCRNVMVHYTGVSVVFVGLFFVSYVLFIGVVRVQSLNPKP